MSVSKENLIEGIGDEVLFVISLILITLIVFLIWLSKDINCFPGYFRRILSHSQTEENNTNNDVGIGYTNDEIIETENEDEVSISIDKEVNDQVNSSNEELIETNQSNTDKQEKPCPEGFISIKLKYLDERMCVINVDPQSSVMDFKRNNFQEELNNNKSIRLIYNGRELKELNGEATLAGYGIAHNCTIHCLVTVKKDNPNASLSSGNENSILSSDINIGRLMFPLFGLILSMVWYYRLNYKHHFNMVSTFALIGITGMYFISCFVNYSTPVQTGRDQRPIPGTSSSDR